MKKAVFTIVAKNYFGFAKALYVSVKKHNPEIDFFVLLSDEIDNPEDFKSQDFEILEAKNIGIGSYSELAFKYNVTEFSTAIKPFFFSYLFEKEYEKVIYFDPDIYIYDNLDSIYDKLAEHDIILTPHFVSPELVSTANAPETLTLFAGIYNLGFIAVKRTEIGTAMIKWWEARLHKYCFVDKFDALHVDQKWMDFVPALFGDKVLILRELGYNIAYWNIHERSISEKNNKIIISNRLTGREEFPLIFIHFSGFNPKNIYDNKQCPILDLRQYADFIPYFVEYAEFLNENNFDMYFHKKYTYGSFDGGVSINLFQRRLFRRLVNEGYHFERPFGIENNDFYTILKQNKLLSNSVANVDKLNERNFQDLDSKISKLNIIMKCLKWVLGFDRYVLLLKFCQRYFRPENQTFLIKEYNTLKFLNENVKK
ncbi:hypothetical protein [Pedobacter rhodius]|uniref:Glycosyl transferase n=1 Tax=Pedobacter rhodius TaxID=3004098 RepID=A0ABT4KZL3_9SPHI|nr:hypothetical protein [Pedobacter sp. SJ11]MCZ4224376.1 hypothetical protein [Pedobacter sp. SJ11]